MPMVSQKQHNLMAGVAHSSKFAHKVGIKQSVGRDFVAAGDAFSGGGTVANKGYQGRAESYAKGGAVLGRTRDFMKVPDEFRNPDGGGGADKDDNYGKSGEGAGTGFIKPPAAKGKSLPPVKPKK